jgi:hypothetical protein
LAPGASAGCRSRWISSKWTRLTCPPTSRLVDLPPLPRSGLRDVVAADSTRRLWKQEAPPLRGLGKASPPRPRWRGHRLGGLSWNFAWNGSLIRELPLVDGRSHHGSRSSESSMEARRQ